ncbi:MAG: hypothetical protein ACRAUW_15040 [Aeromonas sp.]
MLNLVNGGDGDIMSTAALDHLAVLQQGMSLDLLVGSGIPLNR